MKSLFAGILMACCCSLLSAEMEEPNERVPKKAAALLHPTKNYKAQGVVTFTEVEDGVLIVADIDYLEPGKHGFSIHEFGDCSSPDGASIGGHFNPMHHRHGGPDHIERHVGDLGNIVADRMGHAHYERVDKNIQLSGIHSIIGRSIAVHANADDFTSQPSGNEGACAACGVIMM